MSRSLSSRGSPIMATHKPVEGFSTATSSTIFLNILKSMLPLALFSVGYGHMMQLRLQYEVVSTITSAGNGRSSTVTPSSLGALFMVHPFLYALHTLS